MKQLRRWLLIVSLSLASLVGLVAALPSLTAMALGPQAIEGWFNRHYGDQLKVRVRMTELSWNGPQILHGVELLTADGHPILVIERATTDTALSTIIWNKVMHNRLYLDKPVQAQLDFGRDEHSALTGPIQIMASAAEGKGAQLLLNAPISIPLANPLRWAAVQLKGRLEVSPQEVQLEPSFAQRLQVPSIVSLTSTPLNFAMKKGILEVQRVDWILDNQLHFALWGTVGFPGQLMDLVLGIGPVAAKALFNVKGVPAEEFLQVPIIGDADSLGVDTESARRQALFYGLRSKGLFFIQNIMQVQGPPPVPPAPLALAELPQE